MEIVCCYPLQSRPGRQERETFIRLLPFSNRKDSSEQTYQLYYDSSHPGQKIGSLFILLLQDYFTEVWSMLWNIIMGQVKFNRFLCQSEHTHRVFWFLIRQLAEGGQKICISVFKANFWVQKLTWYSWKWIVHSQILSYSNILQ